MNTVPDVGVRMPHIILIVVDLPAPFAPIYPTISPSGTVKLIPSTARISSYFLENSVFTIPERPFPRIGFLNTFVKSLTSIMGTAPSFL